MSNKTYPEGKRLTQNQKNMVDPKDIIIFPKGKFITTPTAAKELKLHIRRVRQLVESGAIKAVQIEEGGTLYIPLRDFEAFAKKPRTPGRPSAKTKPVKRAKKAEKK